MFFYKSDSLLQHGAVAERHHFVYCARDVRRPPARNGFRFERNTVRDERFDRTFGAGWGNSIAIGWDPDVP